jgi:hypothetical protein
MLVALIALIPAPALAVYVDPGAGSLVVQIVISAILGVTFVFHRTISSGWRSVRNAMSRLRRPHRIPIASDAPNDERPAHPDGGSPS